MFCGKCGKEIEERYKFCKYCGAAVGQKSDVKNNQAGLNSSNQMTVFLKKKIKIIAVVLGVIVLGGAVFFAVRSFHSSDDEKNAAETAANRETDEDDLEDTAESAYEEEDTEEAGYADQDIGEAGYTEEDTEGADYSNEDTEGVDYSNEDTEGVDYSDEDTEWAGDEEDTDDYEESEEYSEVITEDGALEYVREVYGETDEGVESGRYSFEQPEEYIKEYWDGSFLKLVIINADAGVAYAMDNITMN